MRMEAVLRDVVVDRGGAVINRNNSDSENTTLAEYWTLGRTGDRWILLSIEQDAEGAHHLDAPIVASPWSDDARLTDEAVTELAVADATPDAQIGELVDVDYAGDGRAQALDLSVVDGRFAPAVLEAAARRAVEAWAEAVDGADDALERAATPEAAHALLYPRGESTRLVVRGPRLQALRIVALEPEPPHLHRRGRAQRPPLPRGPRHRRGAGRLEGPRHHLHRALDARARRRPGDAVADRRDRPGGLATLLLAVPNVSEGRDRETLDAIGAAFVSGGARLLDVHTDPHHHRSVFTLAGEPGRLHEALLEGAREAVERIDLTAHAGLHPRVGVVDVAPVVHRTDAERGAATAEALLLAHRLGRDLGLPVYLYGTLAGGRARASLRAPGALAGLAPDYGPPRLHPTAGATLVAARPPLVAFNVEVDGSLEDARRVAALIREGGEEGLPGVRALGLQLGDLVQVSTNIEDHTRVTAADVVAAVARHTQVQGAELVGLAPAVALEGLDVPLRNRRTLEDHID